MSLTFKLAASARLGLGLVPFLFPVLIAGCAQDIQQASLMDATSAAIAPAATLPAERSALPAVGGAPGDSLAAAVSAADVRPPSLEAAPAGPAASSDVSHPTLKPETLAAIRDARSVKEGGNKTRALSILEKAPDADTDHALLLERGLLTLELGQVEKATELLKKAHDPKSPDWRQHSALGAALSAQGQQQAAQAELAKALAMAPDHPAVLNNLAISYALDGKHTEAEKLLRTASADANADPRAKQNLALILGLRGNIAEARTLSEGVLPPKEVKANVAYLERIKAGETQVSRAEPVADDVPPEAVAAGKAENETPIMNLGGPLH